MSQQNVGMVIDRLLTDRTLRLRFVVDRFETMAELCLAGLELSPAEIELFCRTDVHVWLATDVVPGEARH